MHALEVCVHEVREAGVVSGLYGVACVLCKLCKLGHGCMHVLVPSIIATTHVIVNLATVRGIRQVGQEQGGQL